MAETYRSLRLPFAAFLIQDLNIVWLLWITDTAAFIITHPYLETHRSVIGKQCRPRSEVVASDQGQTVFANKIFQVVLKKKIS